jgi:hypothetical protein
MRVAFAVLCALAAACSDSLARPTYSPQPTSALAEVALPPPPARVEVVPARPSATASWIDGEWSWRRGRWAWMPGRWVEAPAGATFSPWVFVRAPGGTLWYAPGVWRDAKGGALGEPAPLAVATVDVASVVNADGTTANTGPTRRAGHTGASRPGP